MLGWTQEHRWSERTNRWRLAEVPLAHAGVWQKENKNMKQQYPTIIMSQADNFVKIDEICKWAIPKQISTISMHISNLVKIHWDLLSYCLESKIWMYCGQITQSSPKQISTISMHIPSLVTIYWHLLKLPSKNENTDVWQADNCQKLLILFVLRFYGPVNPIGSCRARSVYLTTHLLGRLSPLSG